MGKVKILKASAGSGKTYRLAYEYIRSVIDSPQLYRHILAVTFTNKATEEMKQRIVEELNALANGSPSGYMGDLERDLGLDGQTIRRRAADARTKILHDYSRFTVLTIDKFFQRIIRSFIKELGIDLNFNLELQTDSILDSATDRLIDRIAVDRALRDWVLHFVEEKIDTDGRWDIRGEISQLGRELFGERYRAVSGDKASREELSRIVSAAVARSRRIENEMKKTAAEALAVIDSAGLATEDFAYGRGGCVGYFVKTADGTIAPYGKRVLDALESEEKWVTARSSRKEAARSVVPTLRRLLAKLCSIYDDNIRFLNTARLLSANYRSFALLDDLSEKVAEICTEQNLVPISETNAILGKLMGDNDAPFIYEKVGNTFSRFMIDEFQDTSQGQWSNFVPLLENAVAQSEDEPVLLVGDVKQSIYRWRGGDWRILGRQVASRFKDTRTASLDTNYRSEKTVVEFNNSLIEACVQLDNDRLNRMIQEAAENGRLSPGRRDELSDMLSEAYRDQRQRCSKTREAGYVTVREYEKGEQPDPPLLIRTVEDLQSRGFAAGDIAVLVRTNPQGAAVAQQLLDYKSTHPESPYCYDVVTQEALQIGHSDTAGFIASVFRLAAGSDEPVKRAVYNLYLENPVEQPLTESEQAFIESLGLMSIEEAFEETVLHYRLNEKVRDIAYIQAMQEQVHAFSTSRIADLPLFLKWWDETGAAQSISLPRNRNAITVITIHKAKGLQYKAVVLPDCDWSLQPKTGSLIWGRTDEKPFDSLKHMPLGWSKLIGESAFAEEFYTETVFSHIDNINLFYVAATRAEQELHIQIPRGGKETQRIGSLVMSAIQCADDGSAAIGETRGSVVQDDAGRFFRFGTPERPLHTEHREPEPVASYPTRRIGARLRFRLDSQRYFEDGDAHAPLSPRNYGILMHKLLENAADKPQIDRQLEAMLAEGAVSRNEAGKIRELLSEAFSDPIVASWFDGSWSVVRNEHDIVVPGERSTRRPDRVLTKGAEAVVIDYKFGLKKHNRHTRQVEEYMRLLGRMGYRTVRGYLWYVELKQVENVG